jgi:hypothetical protein
MQQQGILPFLAKPWALHVQQGHLCALLCIVFSSTYEPLLCVWPAGLPASCAATALASWSFNGAPPLGAITNSFAALLAVQPNAGAGFLGASQSGSAIPAIALDGSVFDPSDRTPGTPQSFAITGWNSALIAPTYFSAIAFLPAVVPSVCCSLRYLCSAATDAQWDLIVCVGFTNGTLACQPVQQGRRLCGGGPDVGWLDLYWSTTYDPAAVAGSNSYSCRVQIKSDGAAGASNLKINFDQVSVGATPGPLPAGECS